MKKNLLLMFSIMMLLDLSAQLKGGIEHYSYFNNEKAFIMEPRLHIQTAKGLYGELKYNYEKKGAISFNAGKTFSIDGKVSTIITPMLGIIAGSMKGYSIALNHETELKNFFLSSESQYYKPFAKEYPGCFFSWAELGYNISPVVFTGLALQCSYRSAELETEPGLMSGINFKNISISFYVFNPLRSNCYFVSGLTYDCCLAKRK